MARQRRGMKILIITILVIFLGGTFLSFVSYLMVPNAQQQTGEVQEITETPTLTGENLTGTIATGENQ